MGLIKQGDGRLDYLNVVGGQLRLGSGDNAQFFQAYEGVIRGIRTRTHDYNGSISTKLEIKMSDPSDPDAPAVVISGTLYDHADNVTTWGRMLIARLGNPQTEISGRVMRLSVYPFEDNDKVSCAAVSYAGQLGSFPHMTLPDKNNPTALRNAIENTIDLLILQFGSFGKEETPYPTTQDEMQPVFDSSKNDLPF